MVREERSMTAKFEPRNWTSALAQFKATDKGGHTQPQTPLSSADWHKREQFKVKVIEARVKLKLMRDRTDALKDALERYRAQREVTRA